jgi:HK97 family phage prohead protease
MRLVAKRRITANAAVEYRTATGGQVSADDKSLNGLAVPFNSPTQIGDPTWGFREEFAPGVFTKTLSERDIVLLVNHNSDMPVARASAGTLRPEQTERGLEWNADPVDASYVTDLRANIKAGNLQGCSFGFESVKEDWFDDEGNRSNSSYGTHRVVREAKLHEISVVTFPAYGDTEVSTRDAVTAARERRAKYTADDKKDMLAKGQAMANDNGDPSYPIKDEEDLDNAIHAVGRGGADHDGIRKHIIARAKALGLSSKIPDNWNSDGSLTEEKSADPKGERRSADSYFNCAGCGSNDQYGSYCSQCGASMSPPNNYCTSCGNKLDSGDRSKHVCGEVRHDTVKTDAAHAQDMNDCLAPIDAALDEAIKYFTGAERDSLPAEINQGIDLVTAAAKLVGHGMAGDGEPDPDKPNGNTYGDQGDRSAEPSTDDALRLAYFNALSRKIATD